MNVEFDGGVIEVARRGGRDLLRPRRSDNPFLNAYQGNLTFSPDPRGASRLASCRGRLRGPWAASRAVTVGAAVDDLQHKYDSPGGVTTYAANRSLSITAPDADGRTVIDFNRAVNLPCAHTDFATCPLPAAENRLPVAIEAGEKTPTKRLSLCLAAIGPTSFPMKSRAFVVNAGSCTSGDALPRRG